MAKSDINKEVVVVLRSLWNLIAIVVQMYGWYIRVALLVGIVWAAWKLGRKSVSDPIEDKASQVARIVKHRAWYMIQLPEKIQKCQKVKWVLLLVSLSMVMIALILQYVLVGRHKKYRALIRGLIYLAMVPSVGVLVAWIYEKILSRTILIS